MSCRLCSHERYNKVHLTTFDGGRRTLGVLHKVAKGPGGAGEGSEHLDHLRCGNGVKWWGAHQPPLAGSQLTKTPGEIQLALVSEISRGINQLRLSCNNSAVAQCSETCGPLNLEASACLCRRALALTPSNCGKASTPTSPHHTIPAT